MLPPLDLLKSAFMYCPISGVLKTVAGAVVGRPDKDGYLVMKIRGEVHRVHRICYKMHHGVDPAGAIDHKDTVRTNNAAYNLRPATALENSANRNTYRNNTTGVKGVTTSNKGARYKATWTENGKQQAKRFPRTPEGLAAAAAFLKTKRRALYGEFARD